MQRRRTPDLLRRLPLDGMGGRLLVAILVADVLNVTRIIDFPNGSGVNFAIEWLLAGAVAVTVASLLAARFRPAAPQLRPVEVLAVLAVLAMVMTDITMMWQPLRDLGIYLKAGQHFLAGTPVYMHTTLTVQPVDRTEYPYLYPPFTLPLFGALSLLPVPFAQATWLAGSLCLAFLALRWIGLPRRWAALAVIWPPLFQGLWVGNVAVPALALFALGPWFGAGLPLGAAFKSYTGIATLWLLRERRWVDVEVGVAALVALALVTLPLTGVGLWWKWLDGLRIYQTSQPLVPSMYGFGLPEYIPYPAYVALAVVAVIAALRAEGRESLARFGTATIVASPSLFGHGLLLAVPSLLSLRSPWLWLAIGFLSTPPGSQWWLAVGVVALSWAVPAMRRPVPAQGDVAAATEGPALGNAETPAPATPPVDPLHPLGAPGVAWPGPARARN
jgi:Glycosyltransferase family 87